MLKSGDLVKATRKSRLECLKGGKVANVTSVKRGRKPNADGLCSKTQADGLYYL